MKKKTNSMVLLGIILLLGIGYGIPGAIMKLEDAALWREKKSIEIEEIQLNTQKVDMIETLEIFPEILSNHIVVEVGESEKEEQNNMPQDSEVSNEQGNSEQLSNIVQEFLALLDTKNERLLELFAATNYVMMADKNDERIYSIWSCVGYDTQGNVYYVWVDAISQKIMAFDIPYEVVGDSAETFYVAIEQVVAYYRFSEVRVLNYYFSEKMEAPHKKKYWSNDLLFFDETGEEILSMCMYKNGDRLLFNTYEGSKSISFDAW